MLITTKNVIFRNYAQSLKQIMHQLPIFRYTCERNKIGSLGNLQVNWLTTDDFLKISANGCITFKTLFKMNYALCEI
jgi:hypothetical protein